MNSYANGLSKEAGGQFANVRFNMWLMIDAASVHCDNCIIRNPHVQLQ
jgi:hypothetical protein